MGRNDPVAQFGQRGIRLLRHCGPQYLQLLCEVALPATGVGLRRATPTAAPALPEFLDKRAADTKACGDRALGCGPSIQRLDDTITKVLRVGFHTAYYAANVLYRQLQTALGFWHRLCVNHQTF